MHRKVRENTKAYLDETHVLSYINILKDSIWPNGRLKPQGPERTAEEKARSRDDANRKLSALLPGELQCDPCMKLSLNQPNA